MQEHVCTQLVYGSLDIQGCQTGTARKRAARMLLASALLEALVPDGPGAGVQALNPSEESSVPDTVSAKGKQRVKDLLTGIQQENRKRSRFEWSGEGRVDQFRDAAAMAYREQPQTPSTVCPSSLAPDTRLVLSVWVATGFHGSTALQQALMSAKNVGTLCAGGSWECEDATGEYRCNVCRSFNRPASALPCIACNNLTRKVPNGTEAFRTNLELYEPYWMAQPTKQVLAVKWGVVWGPAMWGMQPDQVEPVPTEAFDLEELETTTVPTAMAASGVARVDWGIILMHRPWCMWSMSHNAREEREEDLELWATRELFETEKLVAQHRKWALDGIPVLVTSYAQMLWRPNLFVDRVKHFAPCIGDVDLKFVPQLGVDVEEANMLKIDGSIFDYGQAVRPETLGVQLDGACSAPAHELYAGLDEGQQARAKLAEDYLRHLANLERWHHSP